MEKRNRTMSQQWGTIVMQSMVNGDMPYAIDLVQLRPVAEDIVHAPYMNKTQIREFRDRILECIDYDRKVSEPIDFYWDKDEFAFTMKESIKIVAKQFIEGYGK